MRTHRTVYRVLNADGTEAYRGKRSAVIRYLGARRLFGKLETKRVQSGRYEPPSESGPSKWTDEGSADSFRLRSNP